MTCLFSASNPVWAAWRSRNFWKRNVLPKTSWGHASDFTKSAAEVTLAREAEHTRNLDEHMSPEDQLLCQGHSFVDNVSVRRRPEGDWKYPEKLPWTEVHQAGKVDESELLIEVCPNIVRHSSDLLLREPSMGFQLSPHWVKRHWLAQVRQLATMPTTANTQSHTWLFPMEHSFDCVAGAKTRAEW
jgi:hypothetical protein